jgi:hypothetical protein
MDYLEFMRILKILRDPTRKNLRRLALYAECSATPWLWSELSTILSCSRSLRPLQQKDAIRKGLRTSPSDRVKMPQKQNFYLAQLTMFNAELKHYCGVVRNLPPSGSWFAEDAKVHTLHGAIVRLLNYAIILLDEASSSMCGATRYGTFANPNDHHYEIYKGAEQVVYGRYSGLTHDDHAPYVGVAVIRTAIEIRLRRAFVIQGIINEQGEFRPIDLNKLFKAVNPQKQRIQFAVDFDDVIKIYRWSNFYLHGGRRDYPWVAGFALRYLHPLMTGGPVLPSVPWSIDDGIKIPRQIWRDIRQTLDPASAKESNWLKLSTWLSKIVRRRRSAPRWTLNEASEENAACTFLD